MDATSSVISLLGIAVNGFNQIQLAREFEKDFALYQLKLDVLQLRLSRWGQVAGVTHDGNGMQSSVSTENTAITGQEDNSAVIDILETIADILERAQDEAQRDNPALDANAKQILDPESHVPRGMKRIRQKLQDCLRRRGFQATKAVNSVKWAFYKKEKFEGFMTSISALLTSLEDLFPEDQKQQLRDLSNEECKGMNKPNLENLKEVVEDCDPWLDGAVDEILKNASNASSTYVNLWAHHNAGNVAGIHHGNNSTTTNYYGRG
ncbi:hypothetical protein ACHAPV_009027 [Trichoderma viride]